MRHHFRARHHAEIALHHCRRQRLGRGAILRIAGPARFRPQAVEDEGKTAVVTAALGLVAAAVLAGAAKFGRPAERQGVAGDRFDTARFRGRFAFGWRAEAGWWTALVGLGLG